MKHLAKILSLTGLLFASSLLVGQDRAEISKIHPDIERYTKICELDAKQIEQLGDIYSESNQNGMELEQRYKELQMKQSETFKDASPGEKQKMKTMMEELAKQREVLRRTRDEKIQTILNDDQKGKLKIALREEKKEQMKAREKVDPSMKEGSKLEAVPTK